VARACAPRSTLSSAVDYCARDGFSCDSKLASSCAALAHGLLLTPGMRACSGKQCTDSQGTTTGRDGAVEGALAISDRSERQISAVSSGTALPFWSSTIMGGADFGALAYRPVMGRGHHAPTRFRASMQCPIFIQMQGFRLLPCAVASSCTALVKPRSPVRSRRRLADGVRPSHPAAERTARGNADRVQQQQSVSRRGPNRVRRASYI
jgi:hypothetical protein